MPDDSPFTVSRRSFFKGLGAVAAATAARRADAVAEELNSLDAEKVHGPDAVPITLKINGQPKKFQLEPRVTLLDALRNVSDLTGAKEVCDRATCGACTILLDGTPVYSCMVLAIEAQGKEITTVEGLAQGGQMTKLQEEFVACDGLQCGFCTPGFLMSLTAMLKTNSSPTEADVRKACSGNLCRCGSYPHIFEAALKASGAKTVNSTEMLRHV